MTCIVWLTKSKTLHKKTDHSKSTFSQKMLKYLVLQGIVMSTAIGLQVCDPRSCNVMCTCQCNTFEKTISCYYNERAEGFWDFLRVEWTSVSIRGEIPKKDHIAKDMNMKYNEQLQVESINAYPDFLQVLNLETMKNQTSLTKLELIDLGIENIPFDAFAQMQSLRTLSLNHNSIATIPITLTLPPNLYELDLSYNDLDTTPDIFKAYIPIRVLNISANKIAQLDKLSFSGLPDLETLVLDFNSHLTIRKDSFRYLRSLHTISARYCNVVDASFVSMLTTDHSRLHILLLEGNDIEQIQWHYFKNTPKLKILDLSQNKLGRIGLAHDITKVDIEELNLAFNNITEISMLGNCKIRKLNLEGNLIGGTIPYWSSKTLEILSLANNRIEDPFILGNMPQLSLLNLSFNKLTRIPHLNHLPNMNTLDLSNNLLSFQPLMLGELPSSNLVGLCFFKDNGISCKCLLMEDIRGVFNKSGVCVRAQMVQSSEEKAKELCFGNAGTSGNMSKLFFSESLIDFESLIKFSKMQGNCGWYESMAFFADNQYYILYAICGSLTLTIIVCMVCNLRENQQHKRSLAIKVIVFKDCPKEAIIV